MKFIQVLLISIILVQKLSCESVKTNSSILADHKQEQLIKGSSDLSANPCEDFYQYACGKWEYYHEEADSKYYTVIGLLDYKVNKEMAGVLNGIKLEDQPKFVNQVHKFFKSCNDLTKYESVKYLKWLTDQENVKFALLGSLPEELDWVRILAVMHIYGVKGIFIEHYLDKSKFPSNNAIELYKPYTDGGFKPLTLENFEKITESFGQPFNDSSKLWRQVQAFELDLQKVVDTDVRRKTVKDLQMPWLKDYMKILLNQTEVNTNVEIIMRNRPYLVALDELLERQSKPFICKYLEIRFLWHLHKQLTASYKTKHCVYSLRRYLSMAMHWLYEQQHPELKEEFPVITKLFENLRKDFAQTIQQNVHAFKETVVDFLLAKINDMDLVINNIPRKDTVQTLENFYGNLDLKDDEDFYANHLILMKFYIIAKLNLESNATQQQEILYLESWASGASSASHFRLTTNSVVIPLTLIQPPLYQPHSADIFKYSTLGFLLAHTMFYGFDNTGLGFDHKGKAVAQEYSSIFSNTLFTDRFNCLLEFKPSEIEAKIADLSGLRYAYKMFNDSRTDGMDVSLRKLFFLNFAQCFCGTSHSNKFIGRETHGPGRARITDALTNFPEFAKVFQCTSSNRMYRDKECYLWH